MVRAFDENDVMSESNITDEGVLYEEYEGSNETVYDYNDTDYLLTSEDETQNETVEYIYEDESYIDEEEEYEVEEYDGDSRYDRAYPNPGWVVSFICSNPKPGICFHVWIKKKL